MNGDASPLEVWPRAREAATRAVSSEPQLAEAQTSLGFLKFWLDWDWAEAETAYRKAIELDPSYPLAHRMLGILLSHLGMHEEAQQALNRARELDPVLAMHQALSAQAAFAARDYAAAVQFARQAIVVDPEFWIGHFQLAQAYVQLGKVELALESLNTSARLSGGNSKAFSLRGYLLAKLGRKDEAMEVLDTLEAIAHDRYVPPYAAALIHAGLDQRDLALNCLERAFQVRDVHLIFLPIDPKWDEFRTDARFVGLVERCGFARA